MRRLPFLLLAATLLLMAAATAAALPKAESPTSAVAALLLTPTPSDTPTPYPTPSPAVCSVITGSITVSDPTAAGVANPQLTPAACPTWYQPLPGLSDPAPRHYDSYHYINLSSFYQCVTVQLAAPNCVGTVRLSVYNQFDPADPTTHYKVGSADGPGGTLSFYIPCCARGVYTLVVEELTPNVGCGAYTLTVLSGPTCATIDTPTPTTSPTFSPTNTPTPAPVSGTISAYCAGPTNYAYSFTITNTCATTATANGGLSFEVAPDSGGPWTSLIHADYFNAQFPPGMTTESGPLWSGAVNPQYHWFRAHLFLVGTSSCGNWQVDTTSPPQPLCPEQTPSPSPSPTTPTTTPTATLPFPSASPTSSATVLTPTPLVTPCTIGFSDVPPTDPFYSYIRCLACRGILSGYADGTFRPSATITRGQTCKIIGNAAGWSDPIPSGQQTFSDVPFTHPFWPFIERAALHGVISGYGDGTFRPDTPVTRSQFAKIDTLATGWSDPIPSDQQTFEDVPPSNPFWSSIEHAALHGVISGYGCGGPGEPCGPMDHPYYRPGAAITRGQAAKIVANTFYPGCLTP